MDNNKEVGRLDFDKNRQVTNKSGTLEDSDITEAPEHTPHDISGDREQLPALPSQIQNNKMWPSTNNTHLMNTPIIPA